ncbi:hypothetical protein [Nonomuraea sp. NEAU-A123]|uniref:hypothetical protein n=1 Tax=Nonomuraea sp. NEAU-A123 TaxID=2839649 RepID=UPI001BE42DB4|nr:hypothetical protein [Nonomuraea sp. NEAU-A123]MBT2225182.1 hypothetical protein [Nonomuraea sp. NEAU-A123]
MNPAALVGGTCGEPATELPRALMHGPDADAVAPRRVVWIAVVAYLQMQSTVQAQRDPASTGPPMAQGDGDGFGGDAVGGHLDRGRQRRQRVGGVDGDDEVRALAPPGLLGVLAQSADEAELIKVRWAQVVDETADVGSSGLRSAIGSRAIAPGSRISAGETTSSATVTATSGRHLGDSGRPSGNSCFWRLLLAVLAPLSMLAQAVNYLLSPVEGGDPFTDTAAVIADHLPLMGGLRWLDAAFVAGIVPATFAVAWAAIATRRLRPARSSGPAAISLGST